MIIGFLGAPNSGKTTIAARVFAELKQAGQPDVEFVAEEARRYIAEKRFETGESPNLTDDDQIAIFRRQLRSEMVMHTAIGEHGILVTDSSALNSLWYMSNELAANYLQRNTEGSAYFHDFIRYHGLLFYCSPVGIVNTALPDHLRLHNKSQSVAIDDKIASFIHLNSSLPLKAHLTGTLNTRVTKALEKIYERITE